MTDAVRPAWRPLLVPAIRVGRLLWRVLPFLAFALLLWVVPLLFGASEVVRDQLRVAGGALLLYAFLRALVHEVLAPERPPLRLIPLSDHKARTLTAGLRIVLALLLVTELGRWLVEVNGWRVSVAVVLGILRSVLVVVVIFGLVASTGVFAWLRSRSTLTFWGQLGRFTGRILVPLLLLAALFLVVVQGMGFVPLARYVALGLVRTGVQLVAAVVAYHYLQRVLANVLRYFRRAGDPEGTGAGVPVEADPALVGAEKIADAAIRLLVVVAALVWILSGWQIGPNRIVAWLRAPVLGGAEGLTWGQMLGGFLKFFGVIVAGWLIRQILTYFVFPRSSMDVGARYALLAVLRYTVIAFAVVFGLEALGLDMGSLGWFFGAAGVGLGFGLQDVIGNFFSGLIMLVERPIRVGDTVQIGDAMGKVEDIRMRGTVIRTFDNTTVLIPNRQMLGERVTNLSYGMGYARVKVEVGVDYGTDMRRVRDILLAVARQSPDILAEPEPNVWLANFGASSVDFTLLCHTAKVTSRATVASDLRLDVFEAFQREGIPIPFPQIDVHVKDVVNLRQRG